jgi:hypothetical protein
MMTGKLCTEPLKCPIHSEAEQMVARSLLLNNDLMNTQAETTSTMLFEDFPEGISPSGFIGKCLFTIH